MAVGDSKSLCSIGFLTIVHDEQVGWIGGYLRLNPNARPLEFHCTSPVKPNRAQQILYGPTLEEYLCGEQIGRTLLGKSSQQPLVVCTDSAAALAVRPLVEPPVALVVNNAPTQPALHNRAEQTIRLDAAHKRPTAGHASRLVEFRLANQQLAVSSDFAGDQDEIVSRLRPFGETLDLCEPFERIREAIEETQLRGR